jgi:large subunit ribosomal protein L30
LANTLKIKLVKSTIGAKPQHKQTIQALGLRKMHQVVEKQDNPQMRGMIQKVRHLVEVEEVQI